MKTAKEIWNELYEEFCKGSIDSEVSKKCSTFDDLIIYTMEIYADLFHNNFDETNYQECDNCKHRDVNAIDEPCLTCIDENNNLCNYER